MIHGLLDQIGYSSTEDLVIIGDFSVNAHALQCGYRYICSEPTATEAHLCQDRSHIEN